jgi:8-oxo-dGTP pyrophosphatase MutT (NUDIX family)
MEHASGRGRANHPTRIETALRETKAEIGISPSEVEVVAELEPVDTRTTGFRVYPYFAPIRPPAHWRLAPSEITSVVTPLVRALTDPAMRREQLLSG